MLPRKTNGLLAGRVSSSKSGKDFLHSLFLVAPALDNYSYQLLSVRHPPEIYPLGLYDYPNDREAVCHTEEQLIEQLRRTFASEATKKVINALLSQIEVASA